MATKTFVNPRPESVRLVLSDGSQRVVGPWGMAIVPRRAEVISAEIVASGGLDAPRKRRHERQGGVVLD